MCILSANSIIVFLTLSYNELELILRNLMKYSIPVVEEDLF